MVEPDPDPLIWQLLPQLFLVMLNAVFACAEIAVISINSTKLERLSEAGNIRAKRLMALTSQPANFLATIQVGITLAGFFGSAFAADNFASRLMNWFATIGVKLPMPILNTVSIAVITLALSYITLVFGELVPKRIAMKRAQAIGLGMSSAIYFLSKMLSPLVWFLTISTNGVLRLLGIDPNAESEQVTEEEIRIMVDAGSDKGAIDTQEKEFIHNLFDFDDLTAEKIMTHRIDVAMLWVEENDEEWERTIQESRYSIYPVCEESKDNVIGVLNIRDYFRLKDKSRESIMQNAVKPAQFVPESVSADVLLRNMRKNHNHFAIIVDEYGGMSGIVTINDLLEQLVGDLDDNSNEIEKKPLIEPIDSSTWSICGIAPINEAAKAIGVELPCEEYDTFAGFVLSLLGCIPENGTTPEVDEYGLNIRVTSVQGHRIETAIVCKSTKKQ
ncbi:MAG: hemolysin family protein [Eubacteriaceae bacterium]|nr:hemolysin family protein [Eubacteriaceae bacterium]